MQFTFDAATVISLIVSVIIPLISAALYRAHWSVTIIGILTLALSFANGFLTQWADAGNTFNWKAALLGTVMSFILAVVSHKGIWKATPLEASLIQFPAPRTNPPPTATTPVGTAA